MIVAPALFGAETLRNKCKFRPLESPRATSALLCAGLGAPITSVDVTHDGKWVVATTANYLMVIRTTFKDKNNKETTGFAARMGREAPPPRLLRLRAEDMAQLVSACYALYSTVYRWLAAMDCGSHSAAVSPLYFCVYFVFRRYLDKPA